MTAKVRAIKGGAPKKCPYCGGEVHSEKNIDCPRVKVYWFEPETNSYGVEFFPAEEWLEHQWDFES